MSISSNIVSRVIICINICFQSFIFLDIEGTPAQELAAIEINRWTHEIVDVFHAFAFTEEEDEFARRHIHGLNKIYLKSKGFPDEATLLAAFKKWMERKSHENVFSNGAYKESKVLGIEVKEFKLLPWADRRHTASHKIAISFKEHCIPILGRKCIPTAHASFVTASASNNLFTNIAKARHGHHCALYDVIELYYECISL